MFGFGKSPANNKATKQSSVNPPASSTSNPFDSDDESNAKQTLHLGKLASSESMLNAEETTNNVNNCLRIAEDIKQDATRTLDMLHAQGEQITRTHNMAADMDKDLSKGEKLLNNLGGIFSKPWKPKKTRDITEPLITADKPSKVNQYSKGEREKLGLAPKGRSAITTPPPEPTNALQEVEVSVLTEPLITADKPSKVNQYSKGEREKLGLAPKGVQLLQLLLLNQQMPCRKLRLVYFTEKAKQDDALSDLSNILGDLKGMAVDMGSELDRQNKALDHLGDDVDELNSRVKGANQRTRHLLGK
ncbi:hypothetical protein Peur_017774 [Populus x canadensis]